VTKPKLGKSGNVRPGKIGIESSELVTSIGDT